MEASVYIWEFNLWSYGVRLHYPHHSQLHFSYSYWGNWTLEQISYCKSCTWSRPWDECRIAWIALWTPNNEPSISAN